MQLILSVFELTQHVITQQFRHSDATRRKIRKRFIIIIIIIIIIITRSQPASLLQPVIYLS